MKSKRKVYAKYARRKRWRDWTLVLMCVPAGCG
jgi:hypothetical protein